MEFIPKTPEHCEGCSSFCSQREMSFRYFRGKEGDKTVFNDNVFHIIYITKGSFCVASEDVDNFVASANQFILACRMHKYTLTALEDVEAVVQDVIMPFFVCERISFANTYAKHLKELKDCYVYNSLEIRKPLQACVNSIAYYIKTGTLCDHLIRAKMQEIFLIYTYYYTTEEIAFLFYPVFNKQMEFYIKVIAAAPKAHTVKQLADMTGYSLSSFKLQFKPFFGDTPYNWIIKHKVDALRIRLLNESIPIKVIVEEFGFSDQSQLNHFCKRYMGGTAIQIRNGLVVE